MTELCLKNGGHHKCEHYDKENGDCFAATSIKGPCECEYKKYCHIPRQQLQEKIKNNFGEKKEDCTFYKMFVKDCN